VSAIQSGLRDAIQAAVPPLYAVRAMSTGVWCWTTSFLSKHIDFHVSVAPSRYGVQHCESDNDTWQPELLPLPSVPHAAPVRSPPCLPPRRGALRRRRPPLRLFRRRLPRPVLSVPPRPPETRLPIGRGPGRTPAHL